jgi:hypothetical protein
VFKENVEKASRRLARPPTHPTAKSISAALSSARYEVNLGKTNLKEAKREEPSPDTESGYDVSTYAQLVYETFLSMSQSQASLKEAYACASVNLTISKEVVIEPSRPSESVMSPKEFLERAAKWSEEHPWEAAKEALAGEPELTDDEKHEVAYYFEYARRADSWENLRKIVGVKEEGIATIFGKLLQLPSGEERLNLPIKTNESELYEYLSWHGKMGERIEKAMEFCFSITKDIPALKGKTIEIDMEAFSGRDHFDPKDGHMVQHQGSSASTVCHEFGHWVEENAPEVREKCVAFLEKRTKGEEEVLLKDLHPDSNYDDDEKTKPDRFRSAYCGKQYDRGSTEILAMGLGWLFSEPVEFAAEDPEYFQFVMGILQGGD